MQIKGNQSRKPLVYKLKAIEEIEKIILKLRLNKKFGTCVGTKLFTISQKHDLYVQSVK